MEKVIAIFFEGEFIGDAKINSDSNTAMGKQFTQYKQYAYSKGAEFIGGVIDSKFSENASSAEASKFILNNFEKGDKVILVGYSNGADGAVQTARELDGEVRIEYMAIIDSSDGRLQNLTVEDKVVNSNKTDNFYQTIEGSKGAILESKDGSPVNNYEIKESAFKDDKDRPHSAIRRKAIPLISETIKGVILDQSIQKK